MEERKTFDYSFTISLLPHANNYTIPWLKRYTKYLRKAKLNLCSCKFMRTEKKALIPLIVKIRVWLRLNGSDPGAKKKPRSESQ